MNDLLYLWTDILQIGLRAYHTADCLNLLIAESIQLVKFVLQQVIQGSFEESYEQAYRVQVSLVRSVKGIFDQLELYSVLITPQQWNQVLRDVSGIGSSHDNRNLSHL